MQYTTSDALSAPPLVITSSSARAATPLLTTAQRDSLQSARTAWQEGEGHLDRLADLSRQQAALNRLRPLWENLRAAESDDATVAPLALILPRVRALIGNAALNKGRATPVFGVAVRQLLFGDDDLPARLDSFFAQAGVGPRSAADLLYTAFPDRFPRFSSALNTLLELTPEQGGRAQHEQLNRYQLVEGEVSKQTLQLMASYAVYEEARRILSVASFAELDAIVRHAVAPPPARDAPVPPAVQESASLYAANDHQEAAAPAPEPVAPTEQDLLHLIEAQVVSKGFTFDPLTIANYYIALKAKPFVILTGLSGTGKTRLTRLIADAITGANDDQYLLLPVRPDWTDGTALFGYHNPLVNRYVSTPLVQLLQTAMQPENRDRAFFVCLDEMNLARVEHYFADALSAMETEDARIRLYENRSVVLGPNVFLTGSVNQDEATFPFSRKVLDRANTIEFAHVRLNAASVARTARQSVPDLIPADRQQMFLQNAVRTRTDAETRLSANDSGFVPRVLETLSALNDLLAPRGLQFGYRVRDEVLRYCAAAFAQAGDGLLCPDPSDNLQTALDLQILQKVLPRIMGTEDALATLLRALTAWTQEHKFSRAEAKLASMRRRAGEDGIVSFYEL